MSETNGKVERGAWGSQIGFVLAAIGSAVGLGNMWRFSANASAHGGAAFVALYVCLTLVIGIPLLLAELALGRMMGLSPIGAIRKAAGKRWVPLGYMFMVTGFLILSFYCVIAGWALRYAIEALLVGTPSGADEHFLALATGRSAVVYHLVFTWLTVLVVLGGVRHGIEKTALVSMPLLFVILLGLAIWSATLPGAAEGYAFYLSPSIRDLWNLDLLQEAAGQTYFSLSLGMGALLTYSSYLSKDHTLMKEGVIIASSDFAVAFTAGLVVFPVVFALGFAGVVTRLGATEAEGVLFIALPGAFSTIGLFGRTLAILFFVALVVAALTSTISLLEVVVSSLIDEFRLSRRVAAVAVGVGVSASGVLPALSLPALSFLNKLAGDLFLGIGALCIAVIVGWVMPDPLQELGLGISPVFRRALPVWRFLIRFVVPVIAALVLVFMVRALFTTS